MMGNVCTADGRKAAARERFVDGAGCVAACLGAEDAMGTYAQMMQQLEMEYMPSAGRHDSSCNASYGYPDCCSCLSDEYPGDWHNGDCCGHCTATCAARGASTTFPAPPPTPPAHELAMECYSNCSIDMSAMSEGSEPQLSQEQQICLATCLMPGNGQGGMDRASMEVPGLSMGGGGMDLSNFQLPKKAKAQMMRAICRFKDTMQCAMGGSGAQACKDKDDEEEQGNERPGNSERAGNNGLQTGMPEMNAIREGIGSMIRGGARGVGGNGTGGMDPDMVRGTMQQMMQGGGGGRSMGPDQVRNMMGGMMRNRSRAGLAEMAQELMARDADGASLMDSMRRDDVQAMLSALSGAESEAGAADMIRDGLRGVRPADLESVDEDTLRSGMRTMYGSMRLENLEDVARDLTMDLNLTADVVDELDNMTEGQLAEVFEDAIAGERGARLRGMASRMLANNNRTMANMDAQMSRSLLMNMTRSMTNESLRNTAQGMVRRGVREGGMDEDGLRSVMNNMMSGRDKADMARIANRTMSNIDSDGLADMFEAMMGEVDEDSVGQMIGVMEGMGADLGDMGDMMDMDGMMDMVVDMIGMGFGDLIDGMLESMLTECDRPIPSVKMRMKMRVADPAAFVANRDSWTAVEKAVARQANVGEGDVEVELTVASDRRLADGRWLQSGGVDIDSTIHAETEDDVAGLAQNVGAIDSAALQSDMAEELQNAGVDAQVTVDGEITMEENTETAVEASTAFAEEQAEEEQQIAMAAQQEEQEIQAEIQAETTGGNSPSIAGGNGEVSSEGGGSAGSGTGTSGNSTGGGSSGFENSGAQKAAVLSGALVSLLAFAM